MRLYPVAGKTSLGDVQLAVTVGNLNEVFVTGYTSQKKKDITGAVAIVNVADMKATPSGSTEALLQGQASGVTVNTTGATRWSFGGQYPGYHVIWKFGAPGT